MSLQAPFVDALRLKASAGSAEEAAAAATALKFVEEFSEDVGKALKFFGPDGRLLDEANVPASAYNDFYKWTMFPVTVATERAFSEGSIQCTFSVNIRDEDYRKQLLAAAKGSAKGLLDELSAALTRLASRKFDRELFERVSRDYSLPGWDENTFESVCGPSAEPRMLAQKVIIDPGCDTFTLPEQAGDVIVQLYVANDCKLGEERVYIEATGPWHRVTWLETSMMQAVYEALFRDAMRARYGVDDNTWYAQWLADAFVRCARSTAAAIGCGMKGALFTGRRTGGLPLMMLQGMYIQYAFRDEAGASKLLGTSSVTSHYWLRDAGVCEKLIPKCAGTHAHELSMVLSVVLGDIDDQAGMPLSQIVGHMLYFYTSLPQGDVRAAERKNLMPMLPDTLGSRAFLKTAQMLTLPSGAHKADPVLSIIGAARQDSGPLDAFAELMKEFDFKGAVMASEIEVGADLFAARDLGYALFGAGGFFGDSEKAWDESKKNISMAVKVLRVHMGGKRSNYFPAKTGDPTPGRKGKFEADGTVTDDEMAALKKRVDLMVAAEPKLDQATLQSLFEATLDKFLAPYAGVEANPLKRPSFRREADDEEEHAL